ncbi:hypothetical protein [Isoptericola sp. NPDC057191]|uniref:hypothetical protein n=1 Tax=Isoptericola sp. NPDC057191 TaxID=3346041 RepID=UPI0036376471
MPLVVAVHGTHRTAESTRDSLAEFAERAGVAVLAPLFPAGLGGPNELNDYKEVAAGGVRYDEVLLAMIDEAAERWSLDTARVVVSGYSGGGQFALRFTLLHADRVRAASIGAPGRVTLLDDEPWPHGIGDTPLVFGRPVDLDALRAVDLQVVVGGLDDSSELLAAVASDPREARAGAGRRDRAAFLASTLEARGLNVRLDIVPAVAHEAAGVLPEVIKFLEETLST